MLDAGLYLGYGLLGLAVIAGLGLPLVQALKSPKNLAKSGVSLGLLAVVFFISYALSGSEITASSKLMGVSEGSSKLIGAGLIMFYITLVIALVGLVYSEINKALK
jgi:threonine/homoserine efflux transporter RhtA